ncbi:MAG: hypothetical protein KJO44_10730 [Gemmatimonadetes bacterium]|nr:hypothetical protein [Gemmatimonadota bacterium]
MKFTRVIRFFAASVLLLPFAFAPLHGQELPIQTGVRVRVVAPPFTDGRLIGTVVAADVSVLVLDTVSAPEVGTTLQLPREAIESLEVSLGRKANAGKGLGLGALGGALLGAGLVGIACGTEGGCASSEVSPVVWVAYGAALGAAAGAVVGTVVGALVRTERWEKLEGVP